MDIVADTVVVMNAVSTQMVNEVSNHGKRGRLGQQLLGKTAPHAKNADMVVTIARDLETMPAVLHHGLQEAVVAVVITMVVVVTVVLLLHRPHRLKAVDMLRG